MVCGWVEVMHFKFAWLQVCECVGLYKCHKHLTWLDVIVNLLLSLLKNWSCKEKMWICLSAGFIWLFCWYLYTPYNVHTITYSVHNVQCSHQHTVQCAHHAMLTPTPAHCTVLTPTPVQCSHQQTMQCAHSTPSSIHTNIPCKINTSILCNVHTSILCNVNTMQCSHPHATQCAHHAMFTPAYCAVYTPCNFHTSGPFNIHTSTPSSEHISALQYAHSTPRNINTVHHAMFTPVHHAICTPVHHAICTPVGQRQSNLEFDVPDICGKQISLIVFLFHFCLFHFQRSMAENFKTFDHKCVSWELFGSVLCSLLLFACGFVLRNENLSVCFHIDLSFSCFTWLCIFRAATYQQRRVAWRQ